MTSQTAATAVTERGTDLFGQPRGLAWLSGTVFWESFSLYGTQAIMIFYMVDALFVPGHIERVIGLGSVRAAVEAMTGPISNQAFAIQLFGLFAGLARFTPLFGGLIGDRLLGRRTTVLLGCALMTAGQFALAVDAGFLIGLGLLMLGSGAISANLFAQVGSLYPGGDRRRDDGLQIYYAALNIGAFLTPLVAGWINVEFDAHTAFAVAGIGMIIGLFVYAGAGSALPADPRSRAATAGVSDRPARLTGPERRNVGLLILLMLVSASFWIAQSQVWNVYNLWVRDHVEMHVLGWAVPVPWLQGLDSLAPVIMLPPALALWRWQAARGAEPDAITKMAIGCLIFGVSMVWLAVATPLFGARVPLAWIIIFHFIDNLGWLYYVPIAVGLYARAAPKSINAMIIGLNTMAVFVGSTISGRIGGGYEAMNDSLFWMLHAGIVSSGALLFIALRPATRRMLARADAA